MITASGYVGIVDLPQRLGRQGHQGGPQMLALPVQRVIGVTDDVRVKGLDLLRQPAADCFQERLDRAA